MTADIDENARTYLEKILAILDIESSIREEALDETTLCYQIDCKPSDAKVLIGKRGQTLESLQFLLRQMCRGTKGANDYFLLDVLNYRSRRREQIVDQAKSGSVAVLNGEVEEYALEPMTPFERRIVHKYLQENFPELCSISRGDGPERHIVISYVGMGEQTTEESPGSDPESTQEEKIYDTSADEGEDQEETDHDDGGKENAQSQ